jgi:signal transduction histidine kinase
MSTGSAARIILYVSFALVVLSTIATVFFGELVLTHFLPTSVIADHTAVLRILLITQALLVCVIGAGTALISYHFFTSRIIRPIACITEAMQESFNDVPIKVLDISYAPKELSALQNIFLRFSQKVKEAHEHDLETSRVKSDFISTAAHQLRTPLTGIRWALEALQKEPLAEGQMVLVQNAVSKSKDLVSVVGTLLDISSIESGKYKYTFTPVALQDLVQHVVNDFQPLATETGVALRYSMPTEEIPFVHADAERITWVLNNLIENAIRYTPREGNVALVVHRSADRVLIEVSDTGIGIAKEDRNNIFERFYRAGNAIAKENKGSGLGLYIARTIVTDHGGDLTFSANTSGTGTTFLIAIPILS